jgi:hypothetical protein
VEYFDPYQMSRDQFFDAGMCKDFRFAFERASTASYGCLSLVKKPRTMRERIAALYEALAVAHAANAAVNDEVTRCNALLGERHYPAEEFVWPELHGDAETRTEIMTIPGRECLLEFRRCRLRAGGWLK